MAWQSGKLGAETAGVRGDWRTPGAARGAVRCSWSWGVEPEPAGGPGLRATLEQ